MKSLYLIILVSLMSNAFARECKVYGISDSPQKLDCSLKSKKIALRCQNGDYFLNDTKVGQAFHYEVEEGPVPLVFKARDKQLVVVIHTKTNIDAELDENGRISTGSCR